MSNKIEIRLVNPEDNFKLAKIIRQVLTEFKANIKGTAFTDTETDALFETYQTPQSKYYVAELNNTIVGGCGIAPLSDKYPDICELQKMYLLPEARSLRIGFQLATKCFDYAKKEGFKQCYLETFPTMTRAQNFYKSQEFNYLNKPLVKSCHEACHIYMLKKF